MPRINSSDTDYAVPTGEFIDEWLQEAGLSQSDLARRMGVSPKHVSKLLSGAPLTPDVALKLSLVTGIDTRIWMGYELTYRADLARLGVVDELASERALAKSFPLADLRARGIITGNLHKPGVVLLELFAFFGVGSLAGLAGAVKRPIVDLRQGTAHAVDEAALATWLRLAALEAAANDTGEFEEFDESVLRELIPKLRKLSMKPPEHFGGKLVDRLASAGVRLQYIPEVKGSRVYGATQWLDGTPVITLTLRGVNDGQFWFTLFHELGHVLLHPRSGVKVNEVQGVDDKLESEANDFASNALISKADAEGLIELRTDSQVRAYADRIGVSAGVVVGRLWHLELWPYSRGHSLCQRLKLTDDQ